VFFFDLLSSTADAFFAYLTDIGISCFVSFAGLGSSLWYLHHDIFAITSIFSIQSHDGVGGGGRS